MVAFCLKPAFLIEPGKLTEQHILLLDGVQLGIVVGDDTSLAEGNEPY